MVGGATAAEGAALRLPRCCQRGFCQSGYFDHELVDIIDADRANLYWLWALADLRNGSAVQSAGGALLPSVRNRGKPSAVNLAMTVFRPRAAKRRSPARLSPRALPALPIVRRERGKIGALPHFRFVVPYCERHLPSHGSVVLGPRPKVPRTLSPHLVSSIPVVCERGNLKFVPFR
jgi:hypothetical protein